MTGPNTADQHRRDLLAVPPIADFIAAATSARTGVVVFRQASTGTSGTVVLAAAAIAKAAGERLVIITSPTMAKDLVDLARTEVGLEVTSVTPQSLLRHPDRAVGAILAVVVHHIGEHTRTGWAITDAFERAPGGVLLATSGFAEAATTAPMRVLGAPVLDLNRDGFLDAGTQRQ